MNCKNEWSNLKEISRILISLIYLKRISQMFTSLKLMSRIRCLLMLTDVSMALTAHVMIPVWSYPPVPKGVRRLHTHSSSVSRVKMKKSMRASQFSDITFKSANQMMCWKRDIVLNGFFSLRTSCDWRKFLETFPLRSVSGIIIFATHLSVYLCVIVKVHLIA